MGARREVLSAVAERNRSAGRPEKGRILDALCRTTGGIASGRCGDAASRRQPRPRDLRERKRRAARPSKTRWRHYGRRRIACAVSGSWRRSPPFCQR